MKMTLAQIPQTPTTKEILVNYIINKDPIDSLTEEFPDDIDLWNLQWEFLEFNTKTVYRYWTKLIQFGGTEDGQEWSDFILNGYLQVYIDEEL